MRQFTAEALVRQNAAGRLISTIMGVEGHYLLRIGDAGVPDTQLQVASSQNQTNSNMSFTLGKWTHVACVFDNGRSTVYFDGRKVLDAANAGRSSVTWGAYGNDKGETSGRYFWLGYSYESNRYLDGDLAEVYANPTRAHEELHWQAEKTVDDMIAAIDHNDYRLLATINKHCTWNRDKKTTYEIPILKASGLASVIDPLEMFCSIEEYFSREKTMAETTEPKGITNDDKIIMHGFDTKTSFRGGK
jgi:hypothetical protein